MKIGLIKLGESLSFNSQSAVGLVSGEPLVLVKILIEHGNHIGLGSIRPKGKDFARPTDLDENLLSFFDLTTRKETDKLNEWADILIVWGGYINFWGGAENSSIMHQYELINKFDGKVFYINTDAIIILEQLIPYIDRKDWAQKYDFADLNITRKDITVITQSMNTELVKSKIEAGGVPVGSIVYKDLWKLPAFNKVQEINQGPKYDLVYGSINNRPKRFPKVAKFYAGYHDLNNVLFGRDFRDEPPFVKKLNGVDSNLDYAGKIKFGQNVINFSNATGTSTVVIGDPIYEDNQLIPNRFIENIYANLVTFFDTDLDKNKRLLSSNPELADFLYVDDREVLREKVLRIRKDFNFRKSICDQQLELVRFDKDAFYNDLMEVFSKDVKIKEVKQEAPKKKLLEY